jgi:hypothetical protein
MISVLADPDVLKLLVTGFEPCLVAAMFSPGIIARYALFSSEKIDEAETRRCSFAAKVARTTENASPGPFLYSEKP